MKSRLSSILVFGNILLFLVLFPSASYCSESSEWLRLSAKIPSTGTTQWILVLITSHFGKDPSLAEATRDFAVTLLEDVGAKGDEVRVVSAEMTPWGKQLIVPIQEISTVLPTAPAQASRGGSDIERILEELAPSAKGPILVLSRGESQIPTGGTESLRGGDGTVQDLERPVKKGFDISA